MTELPDSDVVCANCGAVLSMKSESPCEFCGLTSRHFNLRLMETITMRGGTEAKNGSTGKRVGKHKYSMELLERHELRKTSGEWCFRRRLIDRENDWYKEMVVDVETKKLIHSSAESLSAHQGHGSVARRSIKT